MDVETGFIFMMKRTELFNRKKEWRMKQDYYFLFDSSIEFNELLGAST
jgi:hypothetical protein